MHMVSVSDVSVDRVGLRLMRQVLVTLILTNA